MLSPMNHRRRRRAVVVVCSLLSCTCALSTAFSPTQSSLPSIHTISSPTATTTLSSTNYSHHPTRRSTTTQLHLFNSSSSKKKNTKKKNSPLEDEPWKKDDSYWDQLQAASKDPEQFEKFIEDTMAKKNGTPISSSSSSSAYTPQTEEEEKPKKKKGAYVPIEEWDAQRSKENMTSEERLQWECQRGGNQLRQNDILMHNLKSF